MFILYNTIIERCFWGLDFIPPTPSSVGPGKVAEMLTFKDFNRILKWCAQFSSCFFNKGQKPVIRYNLDRDVGLP